jgi:5-dehydro-2-deoxygluconokinase
MGEERFVASDKVTSHLRKVVPLCDLIVGTEEEMHILGGSSDTIRALESVRAQTSALLVCKLGAMGCVAFPGKIPDDHSDGLLAGGFPVEVFNVLGAGDAFMAGFLAGWLRGEPLQTCCTLANACGAIVVSRHGCAPAMPTKIELEAFLATDDHPFRLRENASLEHLHWATTRRGEYDELTVLAIDHRAQFDDLMNEVNCAEERVAEFKGLAFEALDSVARGDPRFGIIVDERFGSDVLVKAADRPYWVARPIETPKSRPLEFDGGSDLGSVLNRWPATQVVKCLSFYDAGDPPDLREQQETQLLRLFRACRETGHELLLEILAPAETSVDEHSTARALGRLYDIGIMPDWWKLEPTASAAAWQNIVEVIRKRDPHCRGVVLLGLSSPIPDLVASFEAAAPFRLIRGFAVGRTIFHDAARDWLSGAIDDDEAVQVMASRLSALSAAWRTARARVEAVA